MRFILSATLIITSMCGAAEAATCSSYPWPYTLTNGQTADASQVMGDFNNILNCVNGAVAPLASPAFTGFVGIGTASPSRALDVLGSINNTFDVRFKNNNSGASVQTRLVFESTLTGAGNSFDVGVLGSGSTALTGAPNSGIIWNENNASVVFATNNAERMRITPTGVLSIGSPTSSGSVILYVNGGAGGTSGWQTISDARLKKNITPVADALGMVERLNPVTYDFRAPSERTLGKGLALPLGERQIGFIAQEVEKVVPEAVVRPGKGSDAVYGLKEEGLIPVLVAAIKEQQAQIAELRAEVISLKSK